MATSSDELIHRVSKQNSEIDHLENDYSKLNLKSNDIKEKSQSDDQSTQLNGPIIPENSSRSLIILAFVFLSSVVTLGIIYNNFPKLMEEEQYFKLPHDIEDAKNLGRVLSRYKDMYFYEVMVGMFITYIFLQSFAIPGSIFLSILSGFLFSFPLALFLVCLCSAVGASFCYLLSYLVGRPLVHKYIPGRVATWSQHVENHQSNLLNYMIFLRITPFLPNWFINIASPIIGVPLTPFFLGTFIGVAPPSFVAIHAGTTLQKLTSTSDGLSYTAICVLGVLACLSLLPVFLKKKFKFD